MIVFYCTVLHCALQSRGHAAEKEMFSIGSRELRFREISVRQKGEQLRWAPPFVKKCAR